MLENNISLDKLSTTFIANENPVHPAAFNRQSEINYLRGIAKFLIPSLVRSDLFESKLIFSLIRETLTFWVLLPLLDVISDPNLINLLIVIATEPDDINEPKRRYVESEKVYFLEKFATFVEVNVDSSSGKYDLLNDTNILYKLMQILKHDDELDVLHFHMEVGELFKYTNSIDLTHYD